MKQSRAMNPITPSWNIVRTLALIVVVLFLTGMIVQPVSADTYSDAKALAILPSEPQKTNGEIMKEFGTQLMQNAPQEIRSGTNLQKAKYAFTEYSNRLAAANTPVNANYAQRALQLFTNAAPTRWTCGDHTQNLEGLFEGAGIKPQDMIQLEADSDSWLPSANSNHGALVIRDNNGKAYVFDAWGMAVSNLNAAGNPVFGNAGSSLYSGAQNSEWNGMSIEDWGNTMNEGGYVRYSADGESSWDQTGYVAVTRYFNEHPMDESYPSSFTFVIYPKGGGATTRLLYNYPITVNDKGVVSAAYYTQGASPYIQTHNTETTSLADLSVTGTYNKNTGKISGEFSSHELHQSSPSQQYDCWAKGTFTGQMVKGGKTMTIFLEGSAYYYVLDSTPGSNPKTGPVTSKYELPFTAAAVVS
jgi:hypothetical protein